MQMLILFTKALLWTPGKRLELHQRIVAKGQCTIMFSLFLFFLTKVNNTLM